MTQPEVYARHFVVTVDVKRVNKTRPAARSAVQGELGREVVDVARIVVSDGALDKLIAKVTKHLQLIDNDGTHDIDTK